MAEMPVQTGEDQQRAILAALAAGTITVAEAERMLSSLDEHR